MVVINDHMSSQNYSMRKYTKNICFVSVLSFPYKGRSDLIKTNKQKVCLNELIYKTNLENEFIVPCGEA